MSLAANTEGSCSNFIRNNMILYGASIFVYSYGYIKLYEQNVSCFSWINIILMFIAVIFGFVGRNECHQKDTFVYAE